MKFMTKILGIFVFSIIILIEISLLTASPEWSTYGNTTYTYEDINPVFTYNFSSNISNLDSNTYFELRNISSNIFGKQNISFFNWINFNPVSGILTINATDDNQTGNYSILVLAGNLAGERAEYFYFVINATNDPPVFTDINNVYSTTYGTPDYYIINASDEEKHYPLFFNISFTSCYHASWSDRQNCTLFNIRNITNSSAILNLSTELNDVGIYYANISVMDYGSNYICSSGFCLENYSENRTTYYSQLIRFNVFTILDINSSDCENKIFQENQSNTCYINITSRGFNDTLNMSSIANLRNNNINPYNSSWFYSNNLSVSNNNSLVVMINVTPQRSEVGNWTINFSVVDNTFSINTTRQIHVYVNRTIESNPLIGSIPNKITSMNLLTRINITSFDDDFLITDKNISFGGYNESFNYTIQVYNASQINQNLDNRINDLVIQTVRIPINNNNTIYSKLEFTPNTSSFGNYTINVTIFDKESHNNSISFNLTILYNNPPQWINPLSNNFLIFENNITYFNLSKNVTDSDSNNLFFSFVNDTSFPEFSIDSSTGVINFTPNNYDVGVHIVNITVTDQYLTNTTSFNFTIYNVEDIPYIEKLEVSNGTKDNNMNMNLTEDNYTVITLYVQDDDFKIPLNQIGNYNEQLLLNLTIEGHNSSLFNFIKNPAFPTRIGNTGNLSIYEATFTPKKADTGNYNITINITDKNNQSVFVKFNLTIFEANHAPVLDSLSNKKIIVNKTLYYRINASDVEDGVSNLSTITNNNFTYSYEFLIGNDFILYNDSIFNSTTGELNITFNDSLNGKYFINISVKDSTNKQDSKTFWIYVYSKPNITSPINNYEFNLFENTTSTISFKLNNSIGDNLTYFVFIPGVASVLNNYSYYGNNSLLNINFTPDFLNETNGKVNLTIISYPTDNSLENRELMNVTYNWNISINHVDYNLSFNSNIGGIEQRVSGSSSVTLYLSNYFKDYDAIDPKYNQSIIFSVNPLYLRQGDFQATIINWVNLTNPTITFSSDIYSLGNFSITAFEYNITNPLQVLRNVTSNNFTVEINITTSSSNQPTANSGGGKTTVNVPVSMKLITPGFINSLIKKQITIPFTLTNNGKKDLNKISINAITIKNGSINKDILTTLNKNYLDNLITGKSENLSVTVFFDDENPGEYQVLINATVEDPKYNDWAKVYISLQKQNETETKKYLLFTEEYLGENPECMELKELLTDAKNDFEHGNYTSAYSKAEQVISSCKEFISQASLPQEKSKKNLGLNDYLLISVMVSIFLGLVFYTIQRRRFKKGSIYDNRSNNNFNNKNFNNNILLK